MPTPRQGDMRAARDLAAARRPGCPARDAGAGRARRRRASRAGRPRAAARTASEPMKPVSSLQHQPSPASIGPRSSHQVVAVEVEADLQAQRVAGGQAGRRRAAAQQLVPERRRVARGEQQLDAVLARVAGAADQRRHGRRACAAPSKRAGSGAVGERLRRSRAPAGPARRASRSGRRVGHLGVEGAGVGAGTRRGRVSWLAALVTVRKRSAPRR